jgi:RNA polymerase sigma-70 factor, ECF subfamily
VSRALVERAQRGDRDAYEQLARAVAPRLFLIASRILRDPDAAEDAVQQTLVTIWQDLRALRDPDRFDGWAYRIVVRTCRQESRRHQRLGVTIVDLTESTAARSDDLADIAMRDQLGRAFDRLSHDHRTVVVLHHLMGLPLAEVAEILDIPYGTVGSRLHHAMHALRAAIESDERAAVPGGQPA